MIVPLFDKFGVNEAYILLGVFTSSLTRNMIKGLASEGWMYYLGKLCFLLFMREVYNYLVILQSWENLLAFSDCAMNRRRHNKYQKIY